jgi:PERQ amino acid-rich with GYF domain-containing protein
MESTQPTAPIIPQQRAPVIIDDKQWFYQDPQNTVQGPFSSADMERWFAAGYFTILLPVKRLGETQFSTIQQLTKELGRLPFRTDVPSLPSTPVQKQQQPIVPEPQKFNPMTYATSSSSSNNTFIDDYLMQQQQQQQQSRQNVQHPMLFNRSVLKNEGGMFVFL